MEELRLSVQYVKVLNTKSTKHIWSCPSIRVHRFTANMLKSRFCVRETSKLNYGAASGRVWSDLQKLAHVHPRRAAVCNALTRFGQLPRCIPLVINPERSLPQEFSDEEEDIDALILAHNKSAKQHLNSTLSMVTPMSQTHSGKSCMPSAQICTCIHAPSPYLWCVNCVVSCLNAVLA